MVLSPLVAAGHPSICVDDCFVDILFESKFLVLH